MKTALVITSIAAPNRVLHACAAGCREHGIDFIVIGDRKSPPDFSIEGCDFWSIERQLDSGSVLARLLPEGHYSRKNLGYLVALQRGAEVIIETDDDNLPLAGFWQERTRQQHCRRVAGAGWFNPYRCFTEKEIWPRGFPLEGLHTPPPRMADYPAESCHCPIQQGLTDGDPDVDAVYRLTRTGEITFRQAEPVAAGNGSWAPFNSQSTTWFSEAFPLLYLPSFCSFRMTDIWRSFIAQRICWANGWDILFHASTVFQQRNAHDLLADFGAEIAGYLHNAAVCRELDSLQLPVGVQHLPAALAQCYEVFIRRKLIDSNELDLLSQWITSVNHLRRASGSCHNSPV